VESDDNIKPCNGYDITTTLNMTYQSIAHRALLNNLHQYNADEGCVIVMEVATGNILAMANVSIDKLGEYRETKNIALTKYEPGSTFKTASLLVALNDGKVTPNTQIEYSSGVITQTVGHRKVTDDHALKMANPELWHIFIYSSNIRTTRTIYNNYAAHQQQFIDGLYKLGFGDTLRFPIVGGDMKPLLRDPSDKRWWSKLSISTIPMGYEVEVTPLHLLTFYNAIANNGCMVAPRLVTKIASKDSTIRTFNVDTLNAQICSKQALQYIRSMLDSVVTCGTGRKGFIGAQYKVAGKTGTSTINSPDGKGGKLYNASFCGYFPADNPKYSCIVVIKKPREKSYYGGAVALPVFRDIADKIYATDYDLMPEANAISQNKINP
jgi:cell division protein FtsI (penicillin-binding protein 3)